jgi:hypothetical protein
MAAADKANEARLALEKAKKDAESRAGKTTEQRLAEMKAEREKKLAEQAADRKTQKANTPSKQEQAELDRNKKFAEERLAANPDTGAGGIVGSTITKWAIDPKTGKKRTPKEIIDAVTEAVLADKSSGGISLDPLTGKQRSLTPAQKVNQALGQLMQNAMYEGQGYGDAYGVYEYLKKGSRGLTVSSLANRPENWEINKDSVGKIIDRKYFDEPGNRKVFIVDPTRNQLTPEEIKAYQDAGAMTIDPVTGGQVLIDRQGRYTLGDQPNDANIEDYSKYVAPVKPLNYFLNKPGRSGGTTGSVGGNAVGGGSIDALTGLPISIDSFGSDMSDGMGDGIGSSNTSGSGDGSTYAPQNSERKSAYDLLYAQFKQYGLESLVEPLKGFITSGISPSEFVIKLRETDAYKKRFAGNEQRIKKGLAAINEAEYLALEDQYQNIMRNYGLPESYWSKDSMGTQKGFTDLIGNDVAASELEDRIMNAQNRVLKANPEVAQALKQFYPEITNGDILAYTLDPTKGVEDIKRKITAAEIGGAALQSGLQTNLTRAEELRKYGITKDTAQQGYGAIGGSLMRGSQLASIYGEDPYTQTTAEQEVFKIPGAEEARKQRQKITGLEKAAFSGQTGLTSGALARDRAGNY